MRRRHFLALGTAAVAGCTDGTWQMGGGDTRVERGTSTSAGRDREPLPETDDSTAEADDGAATTSIGGSLNGRARRLAGDLHLIEKSNTQWLHAFLDVRGKYEGDTPPEHDPEVKTLREVSAETDVNLIVSLNWDFVGLFGDKEKVRVPSPGSSRERALFEYATELLTAIEHPVNTILLGNEPIWETADADIYGRNPALVPFTRRLKEHLLQNYTLGDPRLFVGSFNRLYQDYRRTDYRHLYDQLFEMARSDDDIAGVDLHIHYETYSEARTMVQVARREVPNAAITATELSPIWRYDKKIDIPLYKFRGGREFAEKYGYPADMRPLDYFEGAKDDRRAPKEMGDFMKTMPWYNVRFVEDMYQLLSKYNVEVGTFGFLLDETVQHTEWTKHWRPFQINYLFQRGLIDSKDGTHPYYIHDYRNRA